MNTAKARTLKAGEIYARIANVNRGGVNVLLYKKCDVDRKILDEMLV